MAEPTPNKEARHRLRQSLTRHLLAATAGVAFASALMFLGFGHPLDWVARLSLTTAFLGLAGVAFALRRDAGTGVQARALPYVIGAAIGLSGVAAAVAGEGLMSPALAIVGVLLCLFTVVGGLRAGILAAAIGAGMLVLLAVAMALDWLSPAGIVLSDSPLNLVRPLLTHALVLAIALGGGELLGRTLDRTLRSADERERRFLGLLAVAADAYWEMDGNGRLIRFSAKEELRNFVGLRRHGVDAGMGKLLWETRGVMFDTAGAGGLPLGARRAPADARRAAALERRRRPHPPLHAERRAAHQRGRQVRGLLGRAARHHAGREGAPGAVVHRDALPGPVPPHPHAAGAASRRPRARCESRRASTLFGFADLRALLGQDLVRAVRGRRVARARAPSTCSGWRRWPPARACPRPSSR